MKKHLLLLLSLLFLISCSSDDDTTNDDLTAEETETTVAFNLDATGTIAEQTAEEAKETINGRWSFGSSSSKGTSSSKGQSCSLNYIEFTDTMYGISIDTPMGEEAAFGNYSMIETNNTVSAVELYVTVLGNNHLIATLTNIVVTENANELNAVFDVVFNIPADYDWSCGTSLSGNYTAEKEEPMADAVDAAPDSKFANLVNTWLLTELYEYEDGERISAIEDNNLVCRYDEITYEEDCEQGSMEVTFSAYGTYLVVHYFANGDVGDWNEGEWGFANSQKTAIFVGEEEYEDIDILEISNLDESVFEGSNSYIEQGEQFVMEFVFTKVTN